jgi:hypothetical protein
MVTGRRQEPHFGHGLADSPGHRRTPVSRLSEDAEFRPGPSMGTSSASPNRWWLWPATCLVLAIVAGGLPLLHEEAGGECEALELRSLGIAFAPTIRDDSRNPMLGFVADRFRRSMASGDLAAAVVRDRYQGVLSPISCTVLYWNSLFHPESLQFTKRDPRQR